MTKTEVDRFRGLLTANTTGHPYARWSIIDGCMKTRATGCASRQPISGTRRR
jgi:hypothetical protein